MTPGDATWLGCTLDGRGVDKDAKRAAGLYLRAAQNGYGDAMKMIAFMYFNGTGVDKNPDEAIKWANAAEQHGQPDVIASFGQAYLTGKVVAVDVSRDYSC